ncbi:hypothetical protein CYMTET_25959 [Cymbomonas tetramitiformis]|uniref:Vitamin K epoxide reductase domain-containing protein n=1 Tax=Cymbomonas tetramitiformis TaxID=36881 RepID=A0AAE0FT71_9CHLO|nr:hypothetical protein CYMTET_25959 [Cymbomonas tetramitiformis]
MMIDKPLKAPELVTGSVDENDQDMPEKNVIETGPSGAGCESVLNSSYGELFGIPLTVFGFLAYVTVCTVSVQGSLKAAESESEDTSRMTLLGGAAILAATSAYLIFTLYTKLGGQPCPYCFTSAGLSTLILLCSVRGAKLPEMLAGGGMALIVSTSLAVGFGDVLLPGQEPPPKPVQQAIDLPYRPAMIDTVSEERYIALAKHLKATGAKMYGAFWCSHCNDQKRDFGAEAYKDLPYVECFPEGYRSGVTMAEVCKEAELTGFPTWKIGGETLEGEQSFEVLARASGFSQ